MLNQIHNKFTQLTLLFATLLILNSCEDVIELDLDDAEQRIVFEARITDQEAPFQVLISKSGSFYAESTFEQVSGATIELKDDLGETLVLEELAPGRYESTTNKVGEVGRTYTLSVNAENTSYTATSTLNTAVEIDSIIFDEFSFGGQDGIFAGVEFRDIPDEENYYMVRGFLNGSIVRSTFSVTNDTQIEGQTTVLGLRDLELESGDQLRVELHSIDKGAYDYFRSLESTEGQGLSADVPYNPTSNWNNDALGYFSAASIRAVEVTVP